MPNWTNNQSDAINAENRNIIVSAAAGSGKTAVLVARVIRMITDTENPVDIDRLLIVTFTNAAAAEMRSRISKALRDIIKSNPADKNAHRQLTLLSNAKICTIDSFCISLVRENFFKLGINQDFTNMDESELSLIEDAVIDEVLNEYFEKEDAVFIALNELMTSPGSDAVFLQSIKKILRFIYAQPFPYRWADEMKELYNPDIPFEESVWYEYIKSEIDFQLDYAYKLVFINSGLIRDGCITFSDEKQRDKFLVLADDDLTEITRFQTAHSVSWEALLSERPASFKNMPNTAKIPEKLAVNKIKSNREIYKKILKEDIPSFLISSEQDYNEDMKMLYPLLCKLLELVREVDDRVMQIKRDKNSYSFSDIEHFAISLLFTCQKSGRIVRTPLANEIADTFYEILVDEYQDTNEAQDLLFKYLSNGKNLFVVGDVKQSIYRFRLAMPNIFIERRKKSSPYKEGNNRINSKIILDKNFRSRRGICSYVNFVFSLIMSERVGEIDYDEDEYLNYGASYNDADVPSAQIKILHGVKGEDTSKKEAAYIAQTVLKKVSSGELIKDGDSYRKVRFGDFAILMRSLKNKIEDYAEVLTDYGIPVVCDNSSNLFDCNEIKIILSLLRTVDNPTLEIPLLATMTSPVYSFTSDELAQIKIDGAGKGFYQSVISSADEKVSEFLDDIRRLRTLSVTMSVAGFIRFICEEKGIISFVNAMGNGEQRYQNILTFISFAENFDRGDNVGLTSFLRYIDKITESDRGTQAAPVTAVSDNAVSIMSVHHSKGLEFPVCIYAGASRLYNKSDLSERLLLNTSYGFGLKCHNEERLYQFQSLPYLVIKNKNSFELMSENLRVLYVAMTRAKEQFITFITCDSLEKKLTRLSGYICAGKIDPYICKKITNDGDLLLLCALLHKDGDELRAVSQSVEMPLESDFDMDIELRNDIETEDKETVLELTPPDEKILNEIDKRLSYSYPGKELSALRLKMAASELDGIENGYEYITSAKPAFMSTCEMTPAQKGTAVHTFMQFCSYDAASADLAAEITRLTSEGFLTPLQAASLDTAELSAFFKSSLAGRIFAADKIYRELKLSSYVGANEIYKTDFTDRVLIQGVADCVFEERGQLVLVDYKTDRIKNENELLDKYKKQISFYKAAVEKTLGLPVKESVLYSFMLKKPCRYELF